MFARSVFKQYQHRLRLIDEGEVFAGNSALALKDIRQATGGISSLET